MLFGLDDCKCEGMDADMEAKVKKSLEDAILGGKIKFDESTVVDSNVQQASTGEGQVIDVDPVDITDIPTTAPQAPEAEEQSSTEAIVADTVIGDMVEESAKNVVYAKYRMDELDQYLEKLDEISFLEAASLIKSLKQSLDGLESAYSIVQAINQMNIGDEANTKIMKSNMLQKNGFDDDIEDFEANYPITKEKLKNIIEKLQVLINARKEQANSTKYLTNEMVELLEKKIRNLDPAAQNSDYIKTRLTKTLEAFNDRLNLSYLLNRADAFLHNKTSLKAYTKMRRETRDAKEFVNAATEGLRKLFTPTQVKTAFDILLPMFGSDELVAMYFMYFLSKICISEERTAYNTWVKVFILNLVDAQAGIFDMGSIETYKSTVEDCFVGNFRAALINIYVAK